MYGKYSQDYIEDVLIRFAYHSTGIEGNTLSLNDTRMILRYGRLPSEQGHSLHEVYEVENHRQTFDYVFQESKRATTFFATISKKYSSFIDRPYFGGRWTI